MYLYVYLSLALFIAFIPKQANFQGLFQQLMIKNESIFIIFVISYILSCVRTSKRLNSSAKLDQLKPANHAV